MVSDVIDRNDRFRGILERARHQVDRRLLQPVPLFEWPDKLEEDMWWMSPSSPPRTDGMGRRSSPRIQLHTASKHEEINFYTQCARHPGNCSSKWSAGSTRRFRNAVGFFHHFIREENEHMWSSPNSACRYGGKIYRQPAGAEAAGSSPKDPEPCGVSPAS